MKSKTLIIAALQSVALLESTVGSGSTFVVTIGTWPLEGITSNAFHYSVSKQSLGVTSVKIAKSLDGMEVLVSTIASLHHIFA
jgi:exo-beta-1,3-glucanase (GH17 family)